MLNTIWLIPILPLAGSATLGILGLISLRSRGEKLNNKVVSAIALCSVGLAFLLSIAVTWQAFAVEHRELFTLDLYEWLDGGSLPLAEGGPAPLKTPIGLQLDPLSGVMILVVTGVGFLIHVYSAQSAPRRKNSYLLGVES